MTLDVKILSVNERGHDSGIPSAANQSGLPILQDTVDVDVWSLWDVTYRDVIVLNAQGESVAVYNLTTNDLRNSGNYATFKDMLIEAAQ